MRVFFLPTSYPDSQHPHTDIFIYEQAKQLAKQGNEVVILHIKKLPSKYVLKHSNKKISEIDDGFAKRYVYTIKTFAENKLPFLSKKRFSSAAEKIFCRAVAIHGKPDVVYAHFSCWAGYSGAIIASKYGIPLVTIEHHSGLMEPMISSSRKEALIKAIDGSNRFLCVSPGLKDAIVRHTGTTKTLHVISNMIDSQFVYHDPVQKEAFTYLAVGNLNTRKDFVTLINAFIMAFSPEEKTQLVIGGDGPEMDRLKKIVQDNKREKQIVFLGGLTREQTIEQYINCDVFALASQFETFGLVYREAMAIGRPIITTQHGGFSSENWHNQYGFMVPVKSVIEFSHAMKNIKENYSAYDLKEISRLCLADCSADSIGEIIEMHLKSACK